MTDINLTIYKAIVEFINELASIFSETQRSLKLYCHLINKTTLLDEMPIQKHISTFREYCVANKDAIINRDISLIVKDSVEYSDKVLVNFKEIFNISDDDTKNIIWDHFLTIYALVDPSGKAKDMIKNNLTGNESKFFTDAMVQLEEHVNPNDDPMSSLSSILQSGLFNNLITGMNDGIQNGSLDISKLIVSLQGMMSTLGSQEDGEQALGMLNSVLGNVANIPTIES